ncbi:MAG TPA: TAXI family TRAP transporter solute-binding subunit [Clostridia bacterium]|nr:TAXI family TRAP transporter solute-binding subunit [Clostridia bacterium]
MKRSTKKVKILACALAVTLCMTLVSGCSSSPEATPAPASGSPAAETAQAFKSKIATNQPGQSWMTMGSTISEYAKGTITLSVEPGSTYGNVLTTNSGETQYGITAATTVSSGMSGTRFFSDKGKQENVRFVASLYRHYLRGFTVKPELKSWADLKGASVCFGPAGGESFDYDPLILSYFGLTKDDYEVKVMPFADGIEAMKNGQLDVILNCTPVPYAIFDDLAMSDDNAHLLQMDEATAKRLASEWPGFEYVEYDFDDVWNYNKPLYAPYQQITLIANANVSDEEVYQMTKLIYERFEDLSNVVTNLKQVGEKNNLAYNPANIPMHPGAEKFYKEVGALK